jgi:hypothetical protein
LNVNFKDNIYNLYAIPPEKAGALYMFLPVIGILYPVEPHHLFDMK